MKFEHCVENHFLLHTFWRIIFTQFMKATKTINVNLVENHFLEHNIWRNTSVQFTDHCKYYQRYGIGPTEQNFLFYHRVKIFRPRANVLRSAMCQPQFDRIINSQTETTKIVLTFWKATLVRTKINKRLTRMYYVGVLI